MKKEKEGMTMKSESICSYEKCLTCPLAAKGCMTGEAAAKGKKAYEAFMNELAATDTDLDENEEETFEPEGYYNNLIAQM